jgi:(1->4)-alpha-D-glucan 1-alpha-D-glucosylmutase
VHRGTGQRLLDGCAGKRPQFPLSASFFDIDWHPVKQELENKILIPILGDQYGTVLENGELCLCFDEGSFFVYYYDHKLPVIPKTYSHILTLGIEALEEELGTAAPQFQELDEHHHLPQTSASGYRAGSERIAERYREKEVVKRRLWSLYQNSGAVREFIQAQCDAVQRHQGQPAQLRLLDALLREQVYRISHWRVATEEINYRRFFDINSLGAIRVEDPRFLNKTHRLVFSLVASESVSGLRVDHADGLRDPEEYFKQAPVGLFCAPDRSPSEDAGFRGKGTGMRKATRVSGL